MEHTNESSWSLCQLVELYIEAKPLEIDHAQSVMRDRNKADDNRESKGWEKWVELPNPADGWIWEMQGKGFSNHLYDVSVQKTLHQERLVLSVLLS